LLRRAAVASAVLLLLLAESIATARTTARVSAPLLSHSPLLLFAAIGTRPLVPAVCLGSTDGNKLAKVTLLNPQGVMPLRRFDRYNCSPKLKLSDVFNRVETADKWGTVFLDTHAVSSGKHSFAIHIASAGQGCGAGIGFADPRFFKPQTRNLGAAEHSWCYSKTGKKSSGAGTFEAYGAAFKTGDVVSAEVDFDEDVIRFYVNGKDQGNAFEGAALRDRMLVPAVVLGSSDGGHLTQLQLVPPSVTRLDPRRCNKHITLAGGDREARTDYRWSSALADHPGASSGVVRFAVKVEGEGGAAVGFAEATAFRPYMHVSGRLAARGGAGACVLCVLAVRWLWLSACQTVLVLGWVCLDVGLVLQNPWRCTRACEPCSLPHLNHPDASRLVVLLLLIYAGPLLRPRPSTPLHLRPCRTWAPPLVRGRSPRRARRARATAACSRRTATN
jgi:hypothetical protein